MLCTVRRRRRGDRLVVRAPVAAPVSMPSRSRQQGWAFLIVLIALAIVAFVARDALMQMLGVARTAPAARSLPADPAAGATPAPPSPVERARSIESTVQQGADERRRRVDEQAR